MWMYLFATYEAPLYNNTIKYPAAAIALAWIYSASSALPIPAYAAYLMWTTRHEKLTLWQVT